MKIPMVEVHCANCGISFRVPADHECLIAWEGCFCNDECEHEKFGEVQEDEFDFEEDVEEPLD
jgi:hypothetical protein